MTGEIVVNGRIGEDCGIGAVTIKELKGLPDCGCGDCNGICGNGKLGEKDGVCGVVVKGRGDDGFCAERKEAFENGRMEGDDQIEAVVEKRENGVLENGDCGTNGHVNEIEVDLARGKHGNEGVERISEEVETDYVADKNRDNGVMEDVAYKAGGLVEENKVEVIEEGMWFVNGKIGEDCAIGAVTMKELKSLPDCSCGDCSGVVGFGSKGSDAVVWDIKKTKKDVANGVAVKENGHNAFGEDRKEVSENGKAEGDDRTGNCIAKEDEVNARGKGVLQIGDCGTNGHVNEINVYLAEGKHSEEGVKMISEIDHVADKNSDNGVTEDMVYKADGLVEENKVKVIEEDIWYVNGKIGEDCAIGAVTMKELKGLPDCGCGDCSGVVGFGSKGSAVVVGNRSSADQKVFENGKIEVIIDVEESNIADQNEPSYCNGDDDCSLSNGVAIEESLSGSLDAKLEDALVEDQNRKVDNAHGDSVNVSSVAAKEEPVHEEVEKEYFVKGEVTDSDPARTETRQEKDSASVDNADAEAVICFGSFGQREFSNLSSEDVTEKEEAQNTVPDPEAEVVEATQAGVVVAEAQPAASPIGQAQASEAYKKLFNYMIKIPRFEDGHLKSKISDAQLQVDEKTKMRDAVKAEMHGKRAIHRESNEKFGAAVMEEKAARELLKSKRQDIDSAQCEITKVKNAMSVGEIDAEISGMEHCIQHETLPLKEERELINKIRKLKQLRGQMSSSIGGQDELTEALNNREQTEERLKNLRKDADTLRENCLKAEAVTKATKKIYQDDSEKLHELQARFKEADQIRQEAYVQLQSLKKEFYEKNKPFWKYRDDAKMAADLALKRDRDSLSQFCIEQVETFMEAWNKSDEFREEYLKSNARRTLRRLGTADGRSLGPNEELPSLPPVVNERPAPEKFFPSLPSPKRETVVWDARVGSAADNVLKKDPDTKKQKPQAKNAIKAPTQLETLMAIMERDDIVEEKEPELTKEERELAIKAEELRKKEEAEKLLEQRRLEEKAKAKEALERKKRNAEKAEARAAQKAQKEAEQKEKEREKRAKKKEKKLVGNMSSDDIPEREPRTPSEPIVEAAPVEPEAKLKPAPTRRPSKPSHFVKQTKIAPIPAPLRNRGKRKMQTWMWAVLVAVLIFVLFLVGNIWNFF